MCAEATTNFLQPDWQAINCYPGGWPFRAFSSELLARPRLARPANETDGFAHRSLIPVSHPGMQSKRRIFEWPPRLSGSAALATTRDLNVAVFDAGVCMFRSISDHVGRGFLGSFGFRHLGTFRGLRGVHRRHAWDHAGVIVAPTTAYGLLAAEPDQALLRINSALTRSRTRDEALINATMIMSNAR